MKVLENVKIAPMVMMRVGGPARFFVHVKTKEELVEAVSFAQSKSLPIFILGEGSNIVVSDVGFSGLVIKMEISGTEYRETEKGVEVIAGAGMHWDDLVLETVSKGLGGLENLSYIPGTVGAAPVQNIGAYGEEIEKYIEWVEVFDTEKQEFKKLSREECAFSYRNSIFKYERKDLIVTRACLLLPKDRQPNITYKDVKKYFEEKHETNPSIQKVRNAVIEIRKGKLPYDGSVGTVGSFFKNPVISDSEVGDLLKKYPDMLIFPAEDGFKKISLAWVIDHLCSFKGHRDRNVGLYKNHSLALVTYDGATANEVISFAVKIQKIVEDKIGVVPEYEVLKVGLF